MLWSGSGSACLHYSEGNPSPPPLRRAAEPFVEKLVVGPPRSCEENMRNRKAEGKGRAGD
jgi:hypothetical protein